MAKDPAFSFYAQDFIIDTFQWTRAAKGLHCDLLSIAWINGYIEANEAGEPLEMDDEGLLLWRSRVKHKWIFREGKLFNNKLEETREKRKSFKESQSTKGRASAQKRSTETQPNNNPGSTPVQPGTTVEPLEKEYEKEKGNELGKEGGVGETNARQPIVQAMADHWKQIKPDYPYSESEDFHALFEIGKFLSAQVKAGWLPEDDVGYDSILQGWIKISTWSLTNDFYKSFSLAYMAKTKTLQTIWQKSKEVKNGTSANKNITGNRKTAGADELADSLARKLAARGAANPGG